MPGMYPPPVAAPVPPNASAPPQCDMVEQLRRLGELRDAGILTEEELARAVRIDPLIAKPLRVAIGKDRRVEIPGENLFRERWPVIGQMELVSDENDLSVEAVLT